MKNYDWYALAEYDIREAEFGKRILTHNMEERMLTLTLLIVKPAEETKL